MSDIFCIFTYENREPKIINNLNSISYGENQY